MSVGEELGFAWGLSIGLGLAEDRNDLATACALAEELGCSVFWCLDYPDALAEVGDTISLVGGATRTAQLGPAVVNVRTRHSSVIANEAAWRARRFGERAVLAVGAGWASALAAGLSPATVKQVRGATYEVVERLRNLDALSVAIYLAGARPRMLELSGEVADGTIVQGPLLPSVIRSQFDAVAVGKSKQSETASSPTIDYFLHAVVDDDDSRALRRAAPYALAQRAVLSSWRHLPHELVDVASYIESSDEYEVAAHLSQRQLKSHVLPPDEFVRMVAAVGSPNVVRSTVEMVVKLGATRIILPLLPGNRVRNVLTLWEEVLSKMPITTSTIAPSRMSVDRRGNYEVGPA